MKAIDTDLYYFNAEIVAAYQRGSDGNAVVKGLLDELWRRCPMKRRRADWRTAAHSHPNPVIP